MSSASFRSVRVRVDQDDLFRFPFGSFLAQTLEGFEDFLGHRHRTRLFVLGVTTQDGDGPIVQVDVLPLQSLQLGLSEAATQRRQNDRPEVRFTGR